MMQDEECVMECDRDAVYLTEQGVFCEYCYRRYFFGGMKKVKEKKND